MLTLRVKHFRHVTARDEAVVDDGEVTESIMKETCGGYRLNGDKVSLVVCFCTHRLCKFMLRVSKDFDSGKLLQGNAMIDDV